MSWKTMRSAAGFMLWLGAGALGACAGQQAEKKGGGPGDQAVGPVATADIQSKSGSSLIGNATFQQRKDKVLVRIQVQNAPPGEHGVHVHETGDCSDQEAKSAGGHFNPNHVDHGAPNSPVHHPGDFGNMTVKPDGTGTLELEAQGLTVADGVTSVQGRSLIIHEKDDDLMTQPTGNAGGRIGCGVIGLAPQGPTGQQPPAGQAPQ